MTDSSNCTKQQDAPEILFFTHKDTSLGILSNPKYSKLREKFMKALDLTLTYRKYENSSELFLKCNRMYESINISHINDEIKTLNESSENLDKRIILKKDDVIDETLECFIPVSIQDLMLYLASRRTNFVETHTSKASKGNDIFTNSVKIDSKDLLISDVFDDEIVVEKMNKIGITVMNPLVLCLMIHNVFFLTYKPKYEDFCFIESNSTLCKSIWDQSMENENYRQMKIEIYRCERYISKNDNTKKYLKISKNTVFDMAIHATTCLENIMNLNRGVFI